MGTSTFIRPMQSLDTESCPTASARNVSGACVTARSWANWTGGTNDSESDDSQVDDDGGDGDYQPVSDLDSTDEDGLKFSKSRTIWTIPEKRIIAKQRA